MKRRKKTSGGMNFWPGYVDALTNVVLNLLFMVAMFGITIAVFNKTPGMGDKASQSAPVDQRDLLVKAIRPGVLADLDVVPPPTLNAPAPEEALVPPGALPEDFDQSEVSILVADAYERRGGPDVSIIRRPATGGGVMLTFDIPRGSDAVVALSKPSVALALQKTLGRAGGNFKLWTSTEAVDPMARRSAYLSLMTLRNQLIKIDISSPRISTHVYEGASAGVSGQRLHLVTTP